MVFEPWRSVVADFELKGAVVERVYSYKHLGFCLPCHQEHFVGTSLLVASARKAMFAMWRRCAELGIRTLLCNASFSISLRCQFLSYGGEACSVKPSLGEAAEVLHRSFLKSLVETRKSTSNQVVLADLGHYPLQVRFWQQLQVLKYHQKTLGLGDRRLVSLAIMYWMGSV